MGPICPPSFFQENAVEVGKACCSLVSTYQEMKNKFGKIKKLTAKTVDEVPAGCQRWISRKEI